MYENIVEFFSREYENQVNKGILFYKFPEEDVRIYVEKIINEPLPRFLTYISELKDKEYIVSKDIFQFSDLYNATDKLCVKMNEANNPGLKFEDIGKILLDDGKERKSGAFVKYGENHAKTAEMLGLVFELYHTYYLSGIGYVYIALSSEDKKKFLTRLILRNKLIMRIYQAQMNGKVNMREFLFMLAESTYTRRRPNVKAILDVLYESEEYNFSVLKERVYFP